VDTLTKTVNSLVKEYKKQEKRMFTIDNYADYKVSIWL